MDNKPVKKGRGGARRGAGKKSRESMGLEPVVLTTVKVEKSVIEACQKAHGSLPNALRFAARYQPDHLL